MKKETDEWSRQTDFGSGMTVLQEPVQVGAALHVVVMTGEARLFCFAFLTEPASAAVSVRAKAALSPPQAPLLAAQSQQLSSVFSRLNGTVVGSSVKDFTCLSVTDT